MNLQLTKGTYVLAISGGVDSMVLLDLAAQLPKNDYTCIVAHFNHGIRADAHKDAELVKQKAEAYGLQYVEGKGNLGNDASEDSARKARYVFLRLVMQQQGATQIVTAHHKDDLVETVLLHVLRGTGRHGLTPMTRSPDILRPLITYDKQQLTDYAALNGIMWHHDSTNDLNVYKRNKLRHLLQQNESAHVNEQILLLYGRMLPVNAEIDAGILELCNDVQNSALELVRAKCVVLPYAVLCEVVIAWLKNNGVYSYNKVLINRVAVAVKTLPKGHKIDVGAAYWLVSGKTSLKIVQK